MATEVIRSQPDHQYTMEDNLSAASSVLSHQDIEAAKPRTVDELIKLRCVQKGCDEPIISYPDEGTNYIDHTIKDIDHLVEQAACIYSRIIPQRIRSSDPVQVIAFLGDSDLSYFISFLAISRLGHAVLLLSTRITDEACESLIKATRATTLLTHSAYRLAAVALEKILPDLRTSPIVDSVTLRNSTARLPEAFLDLNRETTHQSFIIHSSGSTGLPKPIFQIHSASLYSYSQSFGLVGHLTLPLYHNHGISCTFRAIYARKKIYLHNARLPLASQHLLATLREHQDIKILYGVPYALKLLAESAEGSDLLSRLDIVMFGGSACPKPVGDSLVAQGVNLVGHYGATEVGQLMTSFRDFQNDKLWDWLRVPKNLLPYLSMEPHGEGLYELCVRKDWPSKVATNRDDGSYATKDLFEKHPEMENAWRYYARLDDTVVLENGEKANPLTVEGVLRHNRNVAEAVVFGAGKARLGAFIIRKEGGEVSDERIVDDISPAIEGVNHTLPAYARLSKDMIRVLPASTEYRKTDKGTVIRAAFYRDFASQIDAMYVDQTQGSLRLTKEKLLQFLRNEIASKLKSEVDFSNDTDLFSLGVDSLQAIQIRSAILKTLDVGGAQLGRNFAFDFPTLQQMADEILRVQAGDSENTRGTVEDQMGALVEKYSYFDSHHPVDRACDGAYIVVTGATGSLGANVVSRLANMENVRKVYCLVRASDNSAAEARIMDSLHARKIHAKLSDSALQKIVCLSSDLSKTFLGLSPDKFDDIASNITHCLHFAWSVNFNKSLSSFESDCISSVRNLINLCFKARRSQPATFNFCSSVSATVRTPANEQPVPESLPASFSYTQAMGYAQSKLVAENICFNAVKARVLRVGQVIGDTEYGIWSPTEAIPMIFQCAKTIGCLPTLDENPAWLPVDVVAQSFIDISLSDTSETFFNIVNPQTFHWTRDLLPLLRIAGVQFEAVGQREWIRRLRKSETDPEKNPPIKLVEFFAGKYDHDEARRGVEYVTDKARELSPALREVDVVDEKSMKRIVGCLRGAGCL